MTCLLCASTDGGPVVNRVARNGTPQVSVSCARCGFVQVDPMPAADELAEYYYSGRYRAEFPPLPVEGVEPSSPAYELARDHAAGQTAQGVIDAAHIAKGERVHEVGCGDGRVASALGIVADVTAWDADPGQRTLAESRGVRMAERPERVSVVYACQVLEHQADPVATLREWRTMLAEGGRVHVQVPTLEAMYGGAQHFFQWPHVVNFTCRTLYLALRVAGFGVVALDLQGCVLWATGVVAEPVTIAEAMAQCPYPPDDVPALIAHHEAMHGRSARRPGETAREQLEEMGRFLASLPDEREPFAALVAWLQSPDAPATAEVRAQAAAALGEVVRQRDVLIGKIEATQAEICRLERMWSPDPLLWGMTCGQIMAHEIHVQSDTALANNLHGRIGE